MVRSVLKCVFRRVVDNSPSSLDCFDGDPACLFTFSFSQKLERQDIHFLGGKADAHRGVLSSRERRSLNTLQPKAIRVDENGFVSLSLALSEHL